LVVVGGGDSASEEATFLTKYASKVFVLVRRDKLRASKVMADRLLKHAKVEVLFNTAPVEALGDGKLLKGLKVKDTITGVERTLEVNGLFYAIGKYIYIYIYYYYYYYFFCDNVKLYQIYFL